METIRLFILGTALLVVLVPIVTVSYFVVKTVYEYYFEE